MKKLIISLFALVIIVAFNSNSYALFDAGVYGGYSFSGEIKNVTNTVDLKGPEYGIIAHFNTSIIVLLNFGIGGFYQQKISMADKSYLLQTAGLDAYLELNIPIVHPYLKVATPIWQNDGSKSFVFKSFVVGGGAAFTVFPMFQIFGEYTMGMPFNTENTSLNNHSIHLGVRLNL